MAIDVQTRRDATALPLTTFYRGWGGYQRMLVEMIGQLSDDQLAMPAASHDWTIGMVLQHVIANRVWWFQVWMGAGEADLTDIAHWDPADELEVAPRSRQQLLEGLQATWTMIDTALERWTSDDLDEMFEPPTVLNEEERSSYSPCTRGWIIWHVFEHEIHHGGELSVSLGRLGLPGIYGTM
jgi:uncharacterized damage-inducible protein DinB